MTTQADIAELKKRFKPEECSITRFAGAYVDANKNIVTQFNKSFLNLEDTEYKKYLEIIKAIYSKDIENKVLTLEFADEDYSQRKGFLMRLAQDGIKDDAAVEQLMRGIIENFNYIGNYLILLFHDNYDVIKRASDGAELDESEEVYSYIQCIICPVNLEKGGLQYRENENIIGTIDRDWIVGNPRVGFIYPSFEKRSAENEHIIYYTADAMDTKSELITEVLRCKNKYTISQIKSFFENSFFRATKSEELSEEYLQKFNVELSYLIEQEKLDEVLTAGDLMGILENIKIPGNYAKDIVEEYKSFWSENWPKIHWLYNAKKADAYHAQKKKNKGKELLAKAARELLSRGPSETADEIEKYLESTR